MRRRPSRLVVLAGALVDVVLAVPHLPEPGGDVLAGSAFLAAGGGVNVAVAAARLGLASVYGGLRGEGPFGAVVARALAEAGVASALASQPAKDTGFDVVLVGPDGERTFVTAPGCEAELTEAHLARLPLVPGDVLFLTGYDLLYPVSGPALVAFLPRRPPGVMVALDVSPLVGEIPPERLAAVLPEVDLLALNRREAAILGVSPDDEGLGALRRRIDPNGTVLLRLGGEGAALASPEGVLRARAAPAVVVDTTGAGDAHTGAFLAALALGADEARALAEANAAAALAVGAAGPATAPTREALTAFLERLAGGGEHPVPRDA